MNCNLVITNNYGDLLDDIKELYTKSRLLLEKEPPYQFDLSLPRLTFYFPGMKHEVDELYFLLYQENIDLYCWKYKFYDIKDNQVKDSKNFRRICSLKKKALSFKMQKKKKKKNMLS